MENFSYHVPVYVVTGGIKLSGHSSELNAGGVGLYDRKTFSVATAIGNGKEFFFAQGSIGGKDWYGQPLSETHKSPFFFAKDVENMYVSLPQRVQNEEWVIGFNGSPSSKGLRYEIGKPVRVKLYFHGDPIYRFFGGPKEYTISYTPPADCTAPCSENDCPDPIGDCLVHTQKLIDNINNHVELKKFGVVAKLVTNTYTATTANMEKFSLCLCDNGDALALQQVQAQYPGKKITRISRTGSTSCYEFCQREPLAAPADYTQTGSVLQAVCGTCPAGSTLVAAKDVWIVRRPLAGTEDLTTDTTRDNFADLVGSTYGVVADADKTFVGQDGAVGIVKIKVVPGTAVVAILADTVEFSAAEGAQCTFTNPAPIAWTASGTGIGSRRTLRINGLNRPDCNAAGDRINDLKAILAGVEGIDVTTVTKIAGTGCADDYTVQQDSVDCLPEGCLTSNVTFNYDELPAFENHSWEVVPPTVTADNTRKCGIRISAGYIDPKFGNCSFMIDDFYENEPIKMEVSLLVEDGSNCDFATLPTQQQTQVGRIARQSGEYVVREVIMKTDAYLKHVRQFSEDVRMREAFDMNLLNSVDRKAFYKIYYVTFGASYGTYTFRKNEQEKFTAMFAFKEGDAAAQVFETNVLDVLTAKSGVSLHINS